MKAPAAGPSAAPAVAPRLAGKASSKTGYLLVYTATDHFDDAGVPYNPHSSYSIYRPDGRLFKSVENHIAPSDDSPEIVTLPAGPYTIDARSERQGLVRMRVLIMPYRRTVLILDGNSDEPIARFAHRTMVAIANDRDDARAGDTRPSLPKSRKILGINVASISRNA